MLIKFINRGTGSAKSAEEYLLQKHDHKGEIRTDIQVLRGNPSMVTAVADSLEFKHKYTSGIIAWHKNDNPTASQIDQVLDDFERVAFAGLDANQYSWYAVLHEESNGAKHIHVVVPRVELSTGKSMNIAPPNHQKTYDVLVDKYNTKHEWASPKDISKRKAMTKDKMQIHADIPNVQAKQMIHEVINELVERGSIKNNTDVRTKLAEFGEITREGKEYISLKPKGFKKAIRLKGAYYEREFSIERVSKEVRAEQEARIRTNQADRNREYERVSTVLENIIDGRATFNRGRYDRKAQQTKNQDERSPSEHHQGREGNSQDLTHQSRDDRERSREPNAELEQSQAKALANSHSHGHINSLSPSAGNVGNYQVPSHPTPNTSRTKRITESNKELQASSESMGQRDRDKKGISSETGEDRRGNILFKTGGIDHDTVRARIKSNLEDTRRDVLSRAKEHNEDLRKTFKGHDHSVHKADERSVGSDRTAGQHDNEAERNVGEIREHINELADKHRRQSGDSLDRASAEFKKPLGELERTLGLFGRARQGISTAVEQCISRAVEKVREIAERAYSHSFGGGMSP